jgi:hypothetical protein
LAENFSQTSQKIRGNCREAIEPSPRSRCNRLHEKWSRAKASEAVSTPSLQKLITGLEASSYPGGNHFAGLQTTVQSERAIHGSSRSFLEEGAKRDDPNAPVGIKSRCTLTQSPATFSFTVSVNWCVPLAWKIPQLSLCPPSINPPTEVARLSMNFKNKSWQARRFAITGVFLAIGLLARLQADQPQWGDARTHNLVSDETGLPDHFDTSGSGNLRWSIEMGNSPYATTVVVNGKVLIGSNNSAPHDDRFTGIRGTLLCLDEEIGDRIWQLTVPKLTEPKYLDWHLGGICSPPTVVEDKVDVVSNRAEVLCLDLSGLADGNDGTFVDESNFMRSRSDAPVKLGPYDPDIPWHFSMTDQVQVPPHDAAHSILFVQGDHLYGSPVAAAGTL